MKFRPRHDRVVVEQVDAKAKSAGGIIISNTAQEKPLHDEIIAVDPEVHTLKVVLQGMISGPISLIEVPPVTEDPSEFAKLPSLSSEPKKASLTPRQRKVLQLLVSGQSNKEIARSLNLREGTVKVHMSALFRNLGVANRIAAAVVGARLLTVNAHENARLR
jgi:DNA-binding NarL/FixJ family response regulator